MNCLLQHDSFNSLSCVGAPSREHALRALYDSVTTSSVTTKRKIDRGWDDPTGGEPRDTPRSMGSLSDVEISLARAVAHQADATLKRAEGVAKDSRKAADECFTLWIPCAKSAIESNDDNVTRGDDGITTMVTLQNPKSSSDPIAVRVVGDRVVCALPEGEVHCSAHIYTQYLWVSGEVEVSHQPEVPPPPPPSLPLPVASTPTPTLTVPSTRAPNLKLR